MSYLDLSLEEIRKALDTGKVTSEELLKESFDRAKKHQETYNSFVTITEDYALNQLTKIEETNNTMLKGIPYAAKDNFSTKDVLTTGSSNIPKDYIPFFDATAITKLHNAGALMVGKTVLDELAMGGTGTTGHTGAVKNPWDTTRIIGGSSSGSAAAVALGIVPFSIGSDTGDSIRKPAAYGGIVGFKPTYGLISRFGLFAYASSLDHVGCYARSVKDIAFVTDVLKGQDEKDMRTLNDESIKYSEHIGDEVKGKKLFYLKTLLDRETYKDSMDEELDQILKNFDDVIKNCEDLGITVDAVDFDKEILKAIYPTYMTISCAEATSNNSNLTGIIFGPRLEGKNVEEIMFNSRTKGFSEFIKRRFILGSYILQKENQDRLFLNAGRVRRIIVEKMTGLFKQYDGMIAPAAASIAPTFKAETIDRLSDRYLILDNHMAIANFGGFPSITIPCGFVNHMPIGLNVTCGVKKDLDTLNIAYQLENKMSYKGQIAGGESHE